jgi:zinc protease
MLRKSILILFAGLLLLGTQLFADENPLEWDITKTTLDNGLKVIVLEDHSTPSVAYQVWFHVGSKNERPGITGVSHMFEHMMFKGSKNVEPEEHARIIQAKGGMCNAFTHFDMTAYHEVLGAENLETAIMLEAERIEHLNINEENLLSERDVVSEERRTSIDNSPFGPLFELLFNTAYNAHPYSWMVIGWMSDIQNYKVQDLRTYFDTYYRVNNATAVIVGDVKAKDAIALVKKYYGHLKPGPTDLYRPTTVEPTQLGERRAEVRKVAQLPGIFAGYKVCESGHPDMYPLRVLGKVLFDGESSRAYKRLVYDEQICLFAGGDFMELEDPGLFYIIAVMQGPDKNTEDAETALFDEIEKLKTIPLEANELQKALNQLEAEKWFELQSNENKAQAIGYFETIRGSYEDIFTEMDKYLAVTADDVMRVAKKYFDQKNRTVVTLIPDMTAGALGAGF